MEIRLTIKPSTAITSIPVDWISGGACRRCQASNRM